MTFQAAIFDMDGLLLDTERVCMGIFKEACEAQNVPFIEELYLSIIGCNAKRIEQLFREGYGPSVDYPALNQEWRVRYTAVVKHQAIPVKEGVIELLEWLKANKIPMAVATSTQHDIAIKKLELAGIDGYFDVLATGCEVEHGKPHPEIYFLAAERLGIVADACLAFEDSNNGTLAAVAANMITYQIPDLVEPSAEVIKLGHQILPSMLDVLIDLKNRKA
ncbi:HAD family phosphatase [Aliivibrio finisterrensis]|uniref:HAD family phosphatase n=1 Tax=Aliivibrio finisterrensis TaxID=511998 RepID=A0A4Q5KZQ2_9GAMM|nr:MULTISPECIES: HAD family phosphatase [Aliivibrio]MDD9177314.1 HAD family phosphatase [Aliivibrio sp. A6]RYU54798.1 HAD family phosphatase [Aliivibrio finisterrensis]RYU56472.1 HAD family phosphatase [Aliivibrio finisterrensis]RYU61593.1 HAD family phosphatase [Aliivibrio finisterrensis]RYU66818.1 HAD family phosphatase [Aliivibrio finisterrensis]